MTFHQMAAEGSAVRGDEDRISTWLVFQIARQHLALPARDIEEITAATEVEPLPLLPPHVPGVALVRGRPLPVLDIGRWLGSDTGRAATPGLEADSSYFVVVQHDQMTVAVVASRVVGLRPFRVDDLAAPEALSKRLRRIANRQVREGDALVALVDTSLLLAQTRPRHEP